MTVLVVHNDYVIEDWGTRVVVALPSLAEICWWALWRCSTWLQRYSEHTETLSGIFAVLSYRPQVALIERGSLSYLAYNVNVCMLEYQIVCTQYWFWLRKEETILCLLLNGHQQHDQEHILGSSFLFPQNFTHEFGEQEGWTISTSLGSAFPTISTSC